MLSKLSSMRACTSRRISHKLPCWQSELRQDRPVHRLTGARQKVANYAGVTIERKEGHFTSPAGTPVRLLDLPGAYSLSATTPDEAITRDVVGGLRRGDPRPDAIICVVDATNLRLNLRLVLEVKRLGLPMLLALT